MLTLILIVMAIFHLSVTIKTRTKGACAPAAAAYRAGERLRDPRSGQVFDYTRRRGVVHTQILAPEGSPEWVFNREQLWGRVELSETRRDGQIAREIEVSLPSELTHEQRLLLVRQFIQVELVGRGMIADLCLHSPGHKGDSRNHHAHILLTMRRLDGDRFGNKERDWNDKALLTQWREKWAVATNCALDEAGHQIRIDHRSHVERGITTLPTLHLGPRTAAIERKTKRPLDRGDRARARQRRRDQSLSSSSHEASRSRDQQQEVIMQNQVVSIDSGPRRESDARRRRAKTPPPSTPITPAGEATPRGYTIGRAQLKLRAHESVYAEKFGGHLTPEIASLLRLVERIDDVTRVTLERTALGRTQQVLIRPDRITLKLGTAAEIEVMGQTAKKLGWTGIRLNGSDAYISRAGVQLALGGHHVCAADSRQEYLLQRALTKAGIENPEPLTEVKQQPLRYGVGTATPIEQVQQEQTMGGPEL